MTLTTEIVKQFKFKHYSMIVDLNINYFTFHQNGQRLLNYVNGNHSFITFNLNDYS